MIVLRVARDLMPLFSTVLRAFASHRSGRDGTPFALYIGFILPHKNCETAERETFISVGTLCHCHGYRYLLSYASCPALHKEIVVTFPSPELRQVACSTACLCFPVLCVHIFPKL